MNLHASAATDRSYPPGFMVLHGNRLEDLRDLLVSHLKANPLGVLEPEIILLQSNGMKHWLELSLADDGALGICAATRMELPSAYLWQLYRSVLGADAVPAHMPFDKASLLWRLVRLLPVLCEVNPVYQPLQRYLAGTNPARKLYQLAQQVADVLDGYQSYRADWLADWADGQDVLRNAAGKPQPLPGEHAWQAQLWRDIRADLGADLAGASRANVHERFMAALLAKPANRGAEAVGAAWDGVSVDTFGSLICSENESYSRLSGLPKRLIVFGISALPMQAVQALAALGGHCQVLLLVNNPCQYYWGDLVEGHAQLRQQVRCRQQAKLPNVDQPASPTHPLLASWGKQGRDYLHLLDGFDEPERYRAHLNKVEVFIDPASQSATQLAQLQSSILNLTAPPPEPQALPDDGSLCFVTSHSAQRELEVLHDRLLAWFDAEPALRPRDVMVMVPDMAEFAPHIAAVFGRFAPGQPRYIPYSVADTTARQSPLVQALERLLSLPNARLSLADWLALFEVPAVRTRFKLDEAAVQQVQAWLTAAGVRWGLDADHRVAWGLPEGAPGVAQNTWAFGLRRLLLGYALGASFMPVAQVEQAQEAIKSEADDAALPGLWQGTLAQPALSGLDAALAAGLLDWLDAIEQTLPALQVDQTPAQWGQTLQTLVARFFAPADEADERALTRLLEPLDAWLSACDEAALATPLPLEVVREHWLSQISESSLQQRFFGGGVQFGTLMPMRAIPFQVIVLLGMNDGAYPRVQAARDFDLIASAAPGQWRGGDRSRREDDRYLFLEAILSARQKLYISWQGHSASDNSARPPSVLVAQLHDWVNAQWAPKRVAQAQPLQPFSNAYFEADTGFQTFDEDWERIRPLAQVEYAQVAIENIATQTGEQAPLALTLGDLQRLLRHPVEVFFRNRLQVELDRLDELEQEDEPFALNALQQYNAGAALLQAGGGAHAMQRLQAAGELPLAGFGQQVSAELMDKAQRVLAAQAPWLQSYPEPLAAMAVDISLDGGITLTGTLADLRGGRPADLTEPEPALSAAAVSGTASEAFAGLQIAARTGAVLQGKNKVKQPSGHKLVGLWVKHLAACASGLALTSVQLGVDGQVTLQPLSPQAARTILNRLATAYAQALAQPLPVACKTGWAYLLAEQQNLALASAGKPTKDPHETAQAVFEGGQYGGERAESAYLQRAFESYDDLADGLPQWAQLLYGDLLSSIGAAQD